MSLLLCCIYLGERRIRVHTLCLPVATQLSHIYARLNILAITGTLANMGMYGQCVCVYLCACGKGGKRINVQPRSLLIMYVGDEEFMLLTSAHCWHMWTELYAILSPL